MPTRTMKGRVLIAEDEASLRNLIEMGLAANQYEVIATANGREALDVFMAERDNIDVVILDIMMPELDGFSTLEEIRKVSEVPVVMLTALGTSDDVVKGFQMGADDFVVKPFTFREVIARLDAIRRRMQWLKQPAPQPHQYRSGSLLLDVENHLVYVDGRDCHVTPIEFNLLRYFMSHPGQVIGKKELLREVWGYEFEGSTNLIEVGVRRLREKIEKDPSQPTLIRTMRGVGYKFHSLPPSEAA